MKRILLFACLVALLPVVVHGSEEDLLKPFFGYYRNSAYNGVRNIYSGRFFLPTIDISPSLKLKNADGERMRAMNFNFEVPVREEEGMALRFIFPEVPLDGATVTPIENGALIEFSGTVSEKKSIDEWVKCEVHHTARLERFSREIIGITLEKKAQPPCASESHSILASQVFIDQPVSSANGSLAKIGMTPLD